jgi:hypothetical protein
MKTYQYIIHFFKQFFWITPFICFLLGYQILNFAYKSHNIDTPHLVGKSLQQALTELSSYTLNVRLLNEKEDIHIPVGTVISQIPLPNQKIKPHQTVLLTTSKHPQQEAAPQFIGQEEDTAEDFLKKNKIRYKKFFLKSLGQEKICISQLPTAGKELSKDGMIIYFSHDTSQMVLFPNLQNQSVQEVKNFLNQYQLIPTVFHTTTQSNKHVCKHCVIKEQKPLPGSFINLQEPFSIQLKVGT